LEETMMTDESVIEWARGWLRENPPDDPTFRERFEDDLRENLRGRREEIGSLLRDWADDFDMMRGVPMPWTPDQLRGLADKLDRYFSAAESR